MTLLLCNLTVAIDTLGTPKTFYLQSGGDWYRGAGAPDYYRPLIISFANLRRDVVKSGRAFGEAGVSGGVLEVANVHAGQSQAEPGLDELVDHGFGFIIELRLAASATQAYADTTLLAKGTAALQRAGFDRLLVRIRDRREETEKALQTLLFAGTNVGTTGTEGLASDLKDRPKPDAFGAELFQVPLLPANAANEVWQIDAIRIGAPPVVYDGLVQLGTVTPPTAETSLGNLTGSSPAAGTFHYYLGGAGDGAFIKTGTTPKYQLTADLSIGQARGGTTRSLPGDLIEELLTQRAGVASGDISSDDIAAINLAAPYTMGLYVNQPTTVRQAINQIAAACPGWWYPDRFGVFRVKRLVDPAGKSPVTTIKRFSRGDLGSTADTELIAIERLPTGDPGEGVPVWRVVGSYRRAYAVSRDNIDPAARAADPVLIAAAAQETRTVVAEDTSVRSKHPLAIELEIDLGVIQVEAHAQAVVDHLLTILSEIRALYRARARLSPAIANLLDLEEAADIALNRFGLDSGKRHTLTGVQDVSVGTDQVGAVREFDFWG